MTDTHLHREIHEQPEILGKLLATQRKTAQELAALVARKGIGQVVIAARGTSDNAARYAQYVMGAFNGLLVSLATPSLFSVYHRPPRFGNALVLGISQSGHSPDLIAIQKEARSQGALTAALTNDPGSELAAASDVILDLCAGAERAVAATKTYTAELAAIALLSAAIADDTELKKALYLVPEAVHAALSTEAAVREAANRFLAARHAAVIGRGFNLSTAFELALKLTELTYSLTQPYSSADFRHGPLAVIEKGFPTIVVAVDGPMMNDLTELIQTLDERRAEVICITNADDSFGARPGAIRVPSDAPEWLSPMPMIVPGQLLALHLASARGLDVDAPRSIRKITETY